MEEKGDILMSYSVTIIGSVRAEEGHHMNVATSNIPTPIRAMSTTSLPRGRHWISFEPLRAEAYGIVKYSSIRK
jgi:hypothetical protein